MLILPDYFSCAYVEKYGIYVSHYKLYELIFDIIPVRTGNKDLSVLHTGEK